MQPLTRDIRNDLGDQSLLTFFSEISFLPERHSTEYMGTRLQNIFVYKEIFVEEILPLLFDSLDRLRFSRPTGRDLRAFASVSRIFNQFCTLAIENWEQEHLRLQINLGLHRLSFLSANVHEAVNGIIKLQHPVADLSAYADVTEEILEKLLASGNVEHLIVHSDKISKLPSSCSRLQTLDCSGCTSLATIPKGMLHLTALYCSGCTALTSLPEDMFQLRGLHCSQGEYLTFFTHIPTNCFIHLQ